MLARSSTPRTFSRALCALAAVTSVACAAWLSGCAAAQDEELGDSATSSDEVVTEGQLMGSDMPAKQLALTFDDGPSDRTAELADYLAAEGVVATFFINGKNVGGRQAAIDAIVGRGHLLANHTHNHVSMPTLTGDALFRAVADTDAIIREAQPAGPFLLRAPFGAWSGRVASDLNDTSMRKYVGSIFWDVGGALTENAAADWACWGQGVTVARCGELYVSEAKRKGRGIVLMHDSHGRTVDMVKQIVPSLKAEGFTFVRADAAPQVARAIAGVTATQPASGGAGCSSATLGRVAARGACVQAASDRRWYRCDGAEWAAIAAPGPTCTESYALP